MYNQDRHDGNVSKYRPKRFQDDRARNYERNRGGYQKRLPTCICMDFSEEVGNIRIVICKECGTVWVGTGEFNRRNFFYTKMKVDLNYMRDKYPEEYANNTKDCCDNKF